MPTDWSIVQYKCTKLFCLSLSICYYIFPHPCQYWEKGYLLFIFAIDILILIGYYSKCNWIYNGILFTCNSCRLIVLKWPDTLLSLWNPDYSTETHDLHCEKCGGEYKYDMRFLMAQDHIPIDKSWALIFISSRIKCHQGSGSYCTQAVAEEATAI